MRDYQVTDILAPGQPLRWVADMSSEASIMMARRMIAEGSVDPQRVEGQQDVPLELIDRRLEDELILRGQGLRLNTGG